MILKTNAFTVDTSAIGEVIRSELYDAFLGWLPKIRKRGAKKYLFSKGGVDVPFVIITIVLLAFGITLMFSASYVNAWYDAGSVKTGGDPYFYLKKQLVFALIGFGVMYLVSKIRPEVYYDFAALLFVVALILLVLVLIHPMHISGKESFKRWLKIPVLGSIQPSEIAKLAVILYFARLLAKRQEQVELNWYELFLYAALLGIVCVLVIAEKHLSGTIIIFAIGFILTFLGGGRRWVYIVGVVLVALAAIIAVKAGILDEYADSRISIWMKLLHNQELTSAEAKGEGWQILNSIYAIGSGGMFGLGLGNSKQKHLYLPEPQNDFVFAIVCEEMGFVFAVFVMVLFMLLVIRGFQLAFRARDRFSSLMIMGICVHIGLEAALNMAVVSSTIPNTGISLPFFSSGGTALISIMIEIGLVLSVSRELTKTTKGSRVK